VACPEGITRRAVLDLCVAHDIPHAVGDLTRDDFLRADEVFCTGTMGEIAPVVALDGATLGSGAVGPLSARLGELFRALVERECEPLVS